MPDISPEHRVPEGQGGRRPNGGGLGGAEA